MPKPTVDQDNANYNPDVQAYQGGGDPSGPSMREVLATVDQEIMEKAMTEQEITTRMDAPPSPFVYTTATSDAARELVTRRDMLAAMIKEDDGELMFLEEANNRAVRQQADAYAEAKAMVEARRNDRLKAADAFNAVIAGLQQGSRA